MTVTKICKGPLCKGIEKPIEDFRVHYVGGRKYIRPKCKKCEYECKRRKRQQKKQNNFVEGGAQETPKRVVPERTLTEFANGLLHICRDEIKNLEVIEAKEYYAKTNALEVMDQQGFSFEDVKKEAFRLLEAWGKTLPIDVELPPGTYVIVGDAHGKHTKVRTFELLKQINKYLNPNNIIHIGHMLDDQNQFSYCWDDFDNVICVTRKEERRHLNTMKTPFELIRNSVTIGDLKITNQEHISDYVMTQLRTKTPLYPENTVISLHRQERYDTCGIADVKHSLWSTGCLCEPHVVSTVKQIDFTSGYQVKDARSESFKSWRNKESKAKAIWEQGLVVVKVNKDNSFHIKQLKIKETEGEKVTVIFDKVLSSKEGIQDSGRDNRQFFTTDEHIPYIDLDCVAKQDKIASEIPCKDYVNGGDFMAFESWSHHLIGNVREQSNCNALKDLALASWLQRKRQKWADNHYYLTGNHERFLVKDFLDKQPAFTQLFDLTKFYESYITRIPLKEHLKIGPSIYIHGDQRLYNSVGDRWKKLATSYGIDKKKSLIVGHRHFNSIRKGVYCIGLSGDFNQHYNEVDTTSWTHSCALTTNYKDLSFVQIFDLDSDKIWLDPYKEVKVTDKDIKALNMPTFDLEYNFKFEGK